MTIIRHGLLAFSILFTACRLSTSGGVPGTDPGTLPTTPSNDHIPNEPTAWTISPINQEHSYTSVTTAILETTGSPVSSRDTVTSRVSYSLSISRDVTPPIYSARIESIFLQGGPRTKDSASSSRSSFPFTLTGRFEPNRITLELPGTHADLMTTCASEVMAAIPIVHRSLVLPPLQIYKGLVWTDSVVASVCSGPFRTSLSSVRTYLVKGQAVTRNQVIILLEQQNRTSFTGEGAQHQHRIRVQGNGSGRAQLAISADTGVLIEAVADHFTTLTVTSSGRDQTFTQTSREQVTRISSKFK